MTKAEFTDAVHRSSGHEEISKAAIGDVIDAVFSTVSEEVKSSETCKIAGFGTFKLKHRAARMGINPRTKEPIQIAASKTVGFKPASKLKESL